MNPAPGRPITRSLSATTKASCCAVSIRSIAAWDSSFRMRSPCHWDSTSTSACLSRSRTPGWRRLRGQACSRCCAGSGSAFLFRSLRRRHRTTTDGRARPLGEMEPRSGHQRSADRCGLWSQRSLGVEVILSRRRGPAVHKATANPALDNHRSRSILFRSSVAPHFDRSGNGPAANGAIRWNNAVPSRTTLLSASQSRPPDQWMPRLSAVAPKGSVSPRSKSVKTPSGENLETRPPHRGQIGAA